MTADQTQITIYWTGESHITDYDARNYFYKRWLNDEVYLMQRVKKYAESKMGHNVYEYIAVPKREPPCPFIIAERQRRMMDIDQQNRKHR